MVGPQVRRLREAKEWSQSEFARKCQLNGFDASRSTIANIEAQIRKVSDIEFALMARALGEPLKHPMVSKKIPEWTIKPWKRNDS